MRFGASTKPNVLVILPRANSRILKRRSPPGELAIRLGSGVIDGRSDVAGDFRRRPRVPPVRSAAAPSRCAPVAQLDRASAF